jgi:hypothetical protein
LRDTDACVVDIHNLAAGFVTDENLEVADAVAGHGAHFGFGPNRLEGVESDFHQRPLGELRQKGGGQGVAGFVLGGF